jgi:alanyl-tRNA synthetase
MTAEEFKQMYMEDVEVFRTSGNPYKFTKSGENWFVDGLFEAYDTYGIPLEASLEMCRAKNMFACTQQFVIDAINSGWSKAKAYGAVERAEAEVKSLIKGEKQ